MPKYASYPHKNLWKRLFLETKKRKSVYNISVIMIIIKEEDL